MNNQLDNMSRSDLYEEIERLQTYVKDAERYRWLRHGDNDEQVMDLNGSDDVYMLRNEKLDTAIDVAMAEEPPTVVDASKQPAYQYYHKNNNCRADSVDGPDCLCWHDEGTGQYPKARHDISVYTLQWRIKPITKYDKKLIEHLALVEDIKVFLSDHARHSHHWIDDEVIIEVFSFVKPKKVKQAIEAIRL